ncbi:MAG: Tad domain-containing protein [Planctomycetia bacterium]|nr:Tad domain-containing protein [Planctomycetia bacterium]
MAPLTAVMSIVFVAILAFAVDIGYLLVAKSETQNVADAAALAGMGKLADQLKIAPLVGGVPVQTSSDLALAREEVKAFALRNRIGSLTADVRDEDVEFGYMANPYDHTSDALDTTGWPVRPYNAVRVTVRRDTSRTGGPLNLFFGGAIGTGQRDLLQTATAVYAMGAVQPRGNQDGRRGGLLPFTYQVDQWNAVLAANGAGTVVAANGVSLPVTDGYSVDAQSTSSNGVHSGTDGRMEAKLFPSTTTSGNYGTINFSTTKVSNSTSVLRDIIENGPDVADWPDLDAIVQASPGHPVGVNGDPGISAGMECAVQSIIGEPHVIALHSTVSGTGNNTFYDLVGFAPITVVTVDLHGGTKHITIQPRIIGHKSLIDGTDRIYLDLVPSATPNPLFVGARGLVR